MSALKDAMMQAAPVAAPVAPAPEHPLTMQARATNQSVWSQADGGYFTPDGTFLKAAPDGKCYPGPMPAAPVQAPPVLPAPPQAPVAPTAPMNPPPPSELAESVPPPPAEEKPKRGRRSKTAGAQATRASKGGSRFVHVTDECGIDLSEVIAYESIDNGTEVYFRSGSHVLVNIDIAQFRELMK